MSDKVKRGLGWLAVAALGWLASLLLLQMDADGPGLAAGLLGTARVVATAAAIGGLAIGLGLLAWSLLRE